MGAFPALKLAALFVKQVSKPIANFIANKAKNHPVLRTYFIIPPAQLYHWAEVKVKMYIMNLGRPTKVAKLNETMAIDLGASLMSEVIVFGIGGSLLLFEYNRQLKKERKKKEAASEQEKQFLDDIQYLTILTCRQEADIKYLHDVVEVLAKHTKQELPSRRPCEPPELDCRDRKCEGIMNLTANKCSKVYMDSKANTESLRNDDEETSLVRRAIVYYQTKVKADRVS